MTTYAVIGAGAIGGFYGARLAQAGQDVHFVFRDRTAVVKEKGLEVLSPTGDVTIDQVNAYELAEHMPPADVVIVAVKALANDIVAPDVARVVKPGGSVLLIQNGLGCEETFRRAVGPDVEVLGGLAFISSQATGPNQVTHFDHGQLTVGRYVGDYEKAPIDDTMLALQEHLGASEVPVELVDDLLLARWQKLLWNLPFNGLSVVLNALTDAMVLNESAFAVARALMVEVEEATKADGRQIPEGFIDLLIEGTKQMTPYSTSMKVDYNNDRHIEVEAMIGNPLRRAQANGLGVPLMEMLYRLVKFRDDYIATSD